MCSRRSSCPLCPAAAVQCGRPPPEERWGPTRTPGRRLCATLQQSTNVRESPVNSISRAHFTAHANFICVRIYIYIHIADRALLNLSLRDF